MSHEGFSFKIYMYLQFLIIYEEWDINIKLYKCHAVCDFSGEYKFSNFCRTKWSNSSR